MLAVSVAVVLTAGIAGLVYVAFERLGTVGVGLAALRTVGVAALVLVLVNPSRASRTPQAPPTVLLDASLSLGAAGGRWREAVDAARTLAGRDGVILRFGAHVTPFDTFPPGEGTTRLAEALRLAQGRPGPVIVVTDGEVEDAAALEPSVLAATRVVVLPRAAVADAALLDVGAPSRLGPGDSLTLDLTIGTFGALGARRADLVVSLDGRGLGRRGVDLPPAPGTARRRLTFPPVRLPQGAHLLGVLLQTPGDAEPRDDERRRWLSVAAAPDIVVLAAPADWESRFLGRELTDIDPGDVRSFALLQPDRWLDRRTLAPTPAAAVRDAAARASVLIVLGTAPPGGMKGRTAWRWPGTDSTQAAIAGDWYVTGGAPASPLAGRLGAVDWDSLPPLVALVPLVPREGEWVALSAQLGRRGAERPVLLGRDSAGVRQLVLTAAGLWRWALRGGGAREAYRSVLAAGLDWLLGSNAAAHRAVLSASPVAAAGTPVVFAWAGDSLPDSVRVDVTDGATTQTVVLRFDAQHQASVMLSPGAYHWTAGGLHETGAFVVERYSSEYPPRAISLPPHAGSSRGGVLASYARQRAWLFLLVVLALAGEWIGRHRRGLP